MHVCLILSGCSAVSPQGGDKAVVSPAYSYEDMVHCSALMYLKNEPYKWIYLEVDAVEGTEITEETLHPAVHFLETHCQKPVVVHLKKSISVETAKKMPPRVLATNRLEGPPADDPKGPPAFIYMLVHSGQNQPAKTPGGYISLYPCIFIDLSHIKPNLRWICPELMMHECGHALGLWNRPGETSIHCDNKTCLMHEGLIIKWSFRKLLLGKDPAKKRELAVLCEPCEQKLQEIRNQTCDREMEFKGLFRVRKEKEYFVASLPSHLHLGLGPGDKMDWDSLAELARKLAIENLLDRPDGSYTTTFSHNYSNREEMRQLGPIAIAAALNDPQPSVRELAQQKKQDWEKEFGVLPTVEEKLP